MSTTLPQGLVSLMDHEHHAQQLLDGATWAYFNGGAADEITLRANVQAWQSMELQPRVLRKLTGGHTRVQLLGRAKEAVFASARVDGRVVAVGVCCFSHGWASVHGMRTAPSHRGQGLARNILGALAGAAQARKIEPVFLQVDAINTGAQALYRRAGLTTAWTYAYWRKPLLRADA